MTTCETSGYGPWPWLCGWADARNRAIRRRFLLHPLRLPFRLSSRCRCRLCEKPGTKSAPKVDGFGLPLQIVIEVPEAPPEIQKPSPPIKEESEKNDKSWWNVF